MTEDRGLIKRTLDGDRTAFDEIVHRYEDGLFRHLLRMTRRSEEAEDLCQEAFIRFYSALRRFNLERPVASYLFTIATNVWRTGAGKARPEAQPLDDRLPVAGASVAEKVMDRLEYRQIVAAVGRLPPRTARGRVALL